MSTEQYQEFLGKNQEKKNSSLDTLQRLLDLKDSLGLYTMMEELLHWMVPQWSIIKKLITFLQPIKDATEKIFLL
uniref:Uncharacterized protein n=1 Tax=Romanomermis culicivorax TaxID=13658 RepID=A0A915I562_ROMCU